MPKPKKIITTKVGRNLPCVLTDAEKLEYGRKLADMNYSLTEIESEKKAVTDRFKEQLSAVENGMSRVTTAIRDGIERREVECEWIYHWESLTKELVRCDTGEVIEREVIGPDERQLGLDGVDNNEPAA